MPPRCPKAAPLLFLLPPPLPRLPIWTQIPEMTIPSGSWSPWDCWMAWPEMHPPLPGAPPRPIRVRFQNMNPRMELLRISRCPQQNNKPSVGTSDKATPGDCPCCRCIEPASPSPRPVCAPAAAPWVLGESHCRTPTTDPRWAGQAYLSVFLIFKSVKRGSAPVFSRFTCQHRLSLAMRALSL